MKFRAETPQNKQTAYNGRASFCRGPHLLLSEVRSLLSQLVSNIFSTAYEFWSGRCRLCYWGISPQAEENQQVPSVSCCIWWYLCVMCTGGEG